MKTPLVSLVAAALFTGMTVVSAAGSDGSGVERVAAAPTAVTAVTAAAGTLEKRLAKAKLLETRSDGTRVYLEADGSKIYRGDHSVAIVSSSTTCGTIEFGTTPGGAAVVRLGSIIAAAGENGEIVLSDEHSVPADEILRMAEAMKAQAEKLQAQAAELKALAEKLIAAVEVGLPQPRTDKKKRTEASPRNPAAR